MAISASVLEFFRSRPNPIDVNDATRLVDVLDSLAFLDFFLFLEQSFTDVVSLDDVAGCATVGDLSGLLERSVGTTAAR
ncbi:hypothetical protein [Thauera aminoaromatica]|uniref:Acyl carrier protein n=1 Tax=Thauera aminoaromatica TaxID=164330 RepID=A0A5C7S388_THASP|nr:hypothetical protein [Thauera aminoaromatica]TXH78388.1 MAG: hypothetical protein E6Q80_22860 [Thauera aminoaromatica]